MAGIKVVKKNEEMVNFCYQNKCENSPKKSRKQTPDHVKRTIWLVYGGGGICGPQLAMLNEYFGGMREDEFFKRYIAVRIF